MPTSEDARLDGLERIETLFLDAGNTLISLDFDWLAELLATRGLRIEPAVLERAEAAARPRVSARLAAHGSTEGVDAFSIYLEEITRSLIERGALSQVHARTLIADLAPQIQRPEVHRRLWSRVIPGVPQALERARALGLRPAVVSNSNGAIERLLRELGLREHLEAVFDSGRLGFEKPDPRIFEHALATLGARRASTLHVGDLYSADVLGARRAGVRALLLDPFGDYAEAGVNAPTIRSVPALVDRIAAARAQG